MSPTSIPWTVTIIAHRSRHHGFISWIQYFVWRMVVFPSTRSGQKFTSSLHCGRNLPGVAEYESWHCSRLWPCSPGVLEELGPRAQTWLSRFFSRIIIVNTIPKIWRKTKVIAIEKPGKDRRLAESYRPISLLSTCNKLLERLVLHHVSPEVEKLLNPEQARFRRNRSTCEQVAAWTTHIKNGFNGNWKQVQCFWT